MELYAVQYAMGMVLLSVPIGYTWAEDEHRCSQQPAVLWNPVRCAGLLS